MTTEKVFARCTKCQNDIFISQKRKYGKDSQGLMQYYHLDCWPGSISNGAVGLSNGGGGTLYLSQGGGLIVQAMEALIESKFQALASTLKINTNPAMRTIEIKIDSEIKKLEGKILHKQF